MGKPARALLAAFAVAAFCGHAAAQRLLVETTAYSALREAAGVYLHAVDLSRGQVLPGGMPVPGPAPLGSLLLSPDAHAAVVATGSPLAGHAGRPDLLLSYLNAYALWPVQALTKIPADLPAGWHPAAGCFISDGAGTSSLALLLSRLDGTGLWQGRLDLRPFAAAPGETAASWPLPGAPEAAVALPGRRLLAILCRGPYGSGALLHVRDALSGAVAAEVAITDADQGGWGADPAGLALSPDGRRLYVLVSGYAVNRPSGDAASWLYQYDCERFQPVGAPLELPGLGDLDTAPLAPADNGCWIATRDPSAGFAYATRAASGAEGMTLEVQAPFMQVGRPLRIAPSPAGPLVAVAADERLEVWPTGKPGGAQSSFEAPIELLRWTAEGLVLGEGNRVHAIDALTALPSQSLTLQTGAVTDAVLIPAATSLEPDPDADGLTTAAERAARTDPANPDSDQDGLPDGLDPAPADKSPALVLPKFMVFHGESVGQEFRAVRIDPGVGAGLLWQVAVDSRQAPWLTVYPKQGRSGEAFYMGVDAARYPANAGLLQATVTVVSGSRMAMAGNPADILVQVLPAPAETPRVLWLLDPADTGRDGNPQGLDGLQSLLGSAPLRFQERKETSAFVGPLSPYRVVVVTARAAAHGHVTRQAILDYAAEGGAVLFLAEALPRQDSAALERWLSSIGVYLDSQANLSGKFATVRRDWLCRNWKSFEIRAGCGLRTGNSEAALVPGPIESGLAVLIAQDHGRGRVAVLAAPTPLENAVIRTAEHRRFASDLFRWLARLGTEHEDLDGDGLPDRIEDANDNGLRDPGETDRLDADSDGDGLIDGIEDLNRNGRVDEGESSPLNPDSDGDGTFDAADVAPLPPSEAPHVEGVRSALGPAEGGGTVLVSGRNFGPDSQLWFGDLPAAGLRRFGSTVLAARIPPATAPADVDVRVVNGLSGLAGILPNGYRYGPRSAVALTVQALHDAHDQYAGSLSIRLEAPANLGVGQMSFRLETGATNTLKWGEVTPGTGAQASGRRVQKRPAPTGGIWIDVSPARDPKGDGELAVIPWQSSVPVESLGNLSIQDARVFAPHGAPLDVSTTGIQK